MNPIHQALPTECIFQHSIHTRLSEDYERFREQLPAQVGAYVLDAYGLNLSAVYGGAPIPHPFGKASGQLSLNSGQVRRDVEGGLAFVVLKTVIAEDEAGSQSMGAWAIPETHMRVDRVTGSLGEPGWSITWKGRGWHESFERYLALCREALSLGSQGAEGPVPIAASVKYHLPAFGEGAYREDEYRHTTRALEQVWRDAGAGSLLLEKDFSPTLAGDDRSRERTQILDWLARVPGLIRGSAEGPVQLGIKLMNARFDLEFQVELFRALLETPGARPDFIVYANRLFDPDLEYEGVRGAAYGGPDLSRRNLEALDLMGRAVAAGRLPAPPPLSATGDILTGRTAALYGLLGASSCQMHTVFQLTDTEFAARMRNKSAAVLHHLLFHPTSGLVACLLHLSDQWGRPVHWADLPEVGRARIADTAPQN